MSSSSDSDYDEEDTKMQKMLADWDGDGDGDAFVDDDDDEEDDDAKARKLALLKANLDSDEEEESSEEEEDSDEEEEDSDEEEVSEAEDSDEEYEEEVIEEEIIEEEVVTDDDEEVPAEKSDNDEDTVDDSEPIVDTLKKKPKKKKPKKKAKKITDVSEDDTEEDRAMKALLAGWDDDEGTPDKPDDDDDDDSDDEDESEASEREVILDDNVLDHIVLAAPDLEEAMKDFQKRSGIEPVIAGTIKGLGIKCARVSFNDSSYLEIIAPDPNGPGPIGELLKKKGIKELTPFHWAIRSRKCEDLKDEVNKFKYVPDHITMFGAKNDGTPRKWEMLYLYGHKLGGIAPFFINWANSDHPCAKLPVVGKLKKFTIRAPEEDPVHELFEHVGVEKLNLETGKPKISFQFSSPEGTVKFSASKAVGFKFPGFDDDDGECAEDDNELDDMVFENPAPPELLQVGDFDDE